MFIGQFSLLENFYATNGKLLFKKIVCESADEKAVTGKCMRTFCQLFLLFDDYYRLDCLAKISLVELKSRYFQLKGFYHNFEPF